MSYADWNVLMMWQLGWGADRRHESLVLPPPDCIWATIMTGFICAYAASVGRKPQPAMANGSRRARMLGEEGERSIILPVFRPILWRCAAGMALCACMGASVCAIVNDPEPSAPALGVFNFLRVLLCESLQHGVALFFLQPTITSASLRACVRVCVPVAAAEAVVVTGLLAQYLHAEDTSVPKLVMAAVQFGFVCVYGGGVLMCNLGRPALRPYAWFTITWRAMACMGLLLAVRPPAGFPVFLFDFIFMGMLVLGFPLILMTVLISDTQYWRGLGRQTSVDSYNACSTAVSVLCGVGDIGAGLGLRGWGRQQRDALRRSDSATPLGYIRYLLLCGCCNARAPHALGRTAVDPLLDEQALSSPTGPPLTGTSKVAARTSYGSVPAAQTLSSQGHEPVWRGLPFACGACGLGCCTPVRLTSPSRRRHGRRATQLCCFLCPRSCSWVLFVDLALYLCSWMQAWTTRTRRWSLLEGVHVFVEDMGTNDAPPTASRWVTPCCSVPLVRIGLEDGANGPDSESDDSDSEVSYAMEDFDDQPSTHRSRRERRHREIRSWVDDALVLPDDPVCWLMEIVEASRDQLVDFTRLQLLDVVYTGALSVIFRGVLDGGAVAVKVFRPPQFDQAVAADIAAEAYACSRLLHPNIVTYKGMCCCPPDISLVFEWCPRGTLRGVLDRMVALSSESSVRVIEALRGQRNRRFDAFPVRRGVPYLPVRYVSRSAYEQYRAVRRLSKQSSGDSASSLSVSVHASPVCTPQTLAMQALEALCSAERKGIIRIITLQDAQDAVETATASLAAPTNPANQPVPSGRFFAVVTTGNLAFDPDAASSSEGSSQLISPAFRDGSGAALPRAVAPKHASGPGLTPSGRLLPVDPRLHALQVSLRSDIVLLGGRPEDVDECPYDHPGLWPVNDIADFEDCWQFDPLLHTCQMDTQVAQESDSEQEAAPTASGRHGSGTRRTGSSFSQRDADEVAARRAGFVGSRPQELEWIARLRVAAQIASALAYLHGHQPPYLHRDIKASNVLLMQDWTAKLCDLGEAKQLKRAAPMTGNRGTKHYMAPEVMSTVSEPLPTGFQSSTEPLARIPEGEGASSVSTVVSYTEAADVYSLSMLLWELLTGASPYALLSASELATAVVELGARPPIPDSAPRAYAHLMRCAWHPDPGKRPSAKLCAAVLMRCYQEADRTATLQDVGVLRSPSAGNQSSFLQIVREASALGTSASGPLPILRPVDAVAVHMFPPSRAAAGSLDAQARSVPHGAAIDGPLAAPRERQRSARVPAGYEGESTTESTDARLNLDDFERIMASSALESVASLDA